MAELRYRCPRCGNSLQAGDAECDRCDVGVTPAVVTPGDWHTDNGQGRYNLLVFGSQYAIALLLVSSGIAVIAAATGGAHRIPTALTWLWLASPLLAVAGLFLTGGWGMEFLPAFLLPLSFVSFVAGAVAVAFGHLQGFAGAVPMVLTVFGGSTLGRVWKGLRPFENVYRAMLADGVSVALAFVVMLAAALLLMKATRLA